MTEAQRDVIREESKLLTMAEVGRRYGYSRERIRQICKEQPNEAKRAREQAAGIDFFEPLPMPAPQTRPFTNFVTPFRAPGLKWLENIELQTAIRNDPLNSQQVAAKYRTSWRVINKIRTHLTHVPRRAPSDGHRTGFQNMAPEKFAEVKRRASQNRWRDKTPEERSEFARRLRSHRTWEKAKAAAQT